MDDFLSLADKRRSIRSFEPSPLEIDDILYVLRAGMLAPSAGDIQPWEFIVVTDSSIINEVSSLCPKHEWLSQAPIIIVVLENLDLAKTYFVDDAEDLCTCSVSAAVMNMLLAATDRGLGSCWVKTFMVDDLMHLLDIPDTRKIIALVPLGKPAEVPDTKQLLSMEQITFFNSYGNTLTDFDLVLKDFGARLISRKNNIISGVKRSSALDKLSGLLRK